MLVQPEACPDLEEVKMGYVSPLQKYQGYYVPKCLCSLKKGDVLTQTAQRAEPGQVTRDLLLPPEPLCSPNSPHTAFKLDPTLKELPPPAEPALSHGFP